MLFALDLNQTIKFKYHDHDYKLSRILPINDCIKYDTLWNNTLPNIALNILCVACHYSKRYTNSDNFIMNSCSDNRLTERVMFVARTDKDKLINDFIETNIDKHEGQVIQNKTNKNTLITWKNMLYLWKQFLEKKTLPSIIFLHSLKTKLVERLKDYYNEETDCFDHLCSKNLPSIQKFIDFWNTTMYEDMNETDLEIDEIVMLFKRWSGTGNVNVILNEEQIIDLLAYYFPSIEIEENKFIHGFRNILWDKQLDIQSAIDNYKRSMRNNHISSSGITETRTMSPSIHPHVNIYDMYSYYCKFMHSNSQTLIVNKSYFEKFILVAYHEYIIENNRLSNDWYLP